MDKVFNVFTKDNIHINNTFALNSITGYLKSSEDNYDITVVVGGDYQMPLEEVGKLLDPVIDCKGYYDKGNRFLLSKLDDTLKRMPKTRLIGNWIITEISG